MGIVFVDLWYVTYRRKVFIYLFFIMLVPNLVYNAIKTKRYEVIKILSFNVCFFYFFNAWHVTLMKQFFNRFFFFSVPVTNLVFIGTTTKAYEIIQILSFNVRFLDFVITMHHEHLFVCVVIKQF